MEASPSTIVPRTGETGVMSVFTTHRQQKPERALSLEELTLAVTGCPELAEMTIKVRQAMTEAHDNKRDPRVVEAKSSLPAVTVSGTVTERSGAKDFVPSGLIQADIDGLESDKVEELKEKLGYDPHVAAAFTSPTGKGVKAIVRVSPPSLGEDPMVWHAQAFATVSSYISGRFAVEIDPAPKNPASLMYLASDPGLVGHGEKAVALQVTDSSVTKRDEESVSAAFGAWVGGRFKGDLQSLDHEALAKHVGIFRKRPAEDKIFISCPWDKEHTTGGTGSDTAILLKKTDRGITASFRCLHGHCEKRTIRDLLDHIGPETVDSFCERLYSQPDKIVIAGKPAIQLPGDDNLLSSFSAELGKILRNQGVYVRGGIAFIIIGSECVPVDPAMMRTWQEQFLTTFVYRRSGEDRRRAALTMSTDTAKASITAPQFLEQLPELNYVINSQVPVMRNSGEIELLPTGYDQEVGVYTLPTSVEYPEDMPLGEAVKFLNEELLAEFPFVEDGGRSKSVAIAAMLTVYAGGILHTYAQKPTFVYVANSEGSGKTLLAMLAGAPYGIVTVTSPPTNETEWSKTLLSVVIGGRRLVIVDNVRGFLASPSLEGYLTSPQYEGRILGQSKIYRGDAGAVVLITGNQLTVTPDLRRRSLFVELFSEQLRAEDRVFKRSLDQAALLELQPKILGALWALVRSWDEAGRPEGSLHHASFNRWARVMGGILENAGYANPCQRPRIDTMGDRDTGDMEKLAGVLELGKRYEFADLVDIAVDYGLFERATTERDDVDLTRKGKSVMSKILARYDRKIVSQNSRFVIVGNGHNRRYQLETI